MTGEFQPEVAAIVTGFTCRMTLLCEAMERSARALEAFADAASNGYSDLEDADEDYHCDACDGTGFMNVCPDDICQGGGECIHGDGDILCPECHGESAL